MNWLEQARQQGMADAREGKKTTGLSVLRTVHKKPYRNYFFSKNYEEEAVTPELVTQFLQKYTLPLIAILQDLQQYSADEQHPEFIISPLQYLYLFLGDTEDVGDATAYSLTKQEKSYRGLTDYLVYETYAFGVRSTIQFWTKEYLADIRILPITTRDTHYGGVDFVVGKYIQEDEDSFDAEEIQRHIRSEIAQIYTRFIHKQARYFHW